VTQVFRLDEKARLEELKMAARALGQDPEVLAVVLFGSLARGEATAMSDADLLVLLEETTLPFPERLVRYRPQGVRRVEVFPYTLEEARRGLGCRRWPSGMDFSFGPGRGPGSASRL
jgi:hypothetical protein